MLSSRRRNTQGRRPSSRVSRVNVPKEDPATVKKFLSAVQTKEKLHMGPQGAADALAIKLATLREMNPGGVQSSEFLLSREAREAREKRDLDAANLAKSERISDNIGWSPTLFGGKGGKQRGGGVVPPDDKNRLAKMEVLRQVTYENVPPGTDNEGLTCKNLAKATSSNSCPAGTVAKAVAGTWEKAKKDKQFAFDVCCEAEPALSTEEKEKGVSSGSRFFSVSRAKEAAVYRFLKRVEQDMSVINGYFEKFGPAIQQKFNDDPQVKERFVKAMDNLKFVWKVISSEMTYCSEQLRNAEKTASDFSYEEARSDLVFSGCGPELVDRLFISSKVLYFKRLKAVTTIMKKVVANYDYEKYSKQREEIGSSNSYAVSKWMQLLGTTVSESFSKSWGFVKYQVGGLGATTMIAFGAGFLAVMMMIATGLGPLGLLGAVGVQMPGAASVALMQSYGIAVKVSAEKVLESITLPIFANITATIPGPILLMVKAMPALMWLFQRMSIVSKALAFMKEQMLNYVSGSGHVYRGLRSLFNKFTVLASQTPQFRSAVLTASADEVVNMDADFYAKIEQTAKKPELGMGMSLLGRFINIFIGMMESKTMQWVLWFGQVGGNLVDNSVTGLAAKSMSALAAGAARVTNAIGTDFGVSAAVTAATAVMQKMVGKTFLASPLEEFGTFQNEVSDMVGIAERDIIPEMTMENISLVTGKAIKNRFHALLPDVVFKKLFDPVTDDAQVYVPMSLWEYGDKVKTSGDELLKTILQGDSQKTYQQTFEAIKKNWGEQSTDISGFVAKGLWGFSKADIEKMYEEGVTDKTLVLRYAVSKAREGIISSNYTVTEEAANALNAAAQAASQQAEVIAQAEKIRKAILGSIPEPPASMKAALNLEITAESMASAEKDVKNSYIVWVADDADDMAVSAAKTEMIKDTMEKLVDRYQVDGLFNAVMKNFESIKFKVIEVVGKASEAQGYAQADNVSFNEAVNNMGEDATKIRAAMTEAGSNNLESYTMPSNFRSLNKEELVKLFKSDQQQAMSAVMRDYTLRGMASTVKIQVGEYATLVKQKAYEKADALTQHILGISLNDFSNWSNADLAWFLGIIMLFMAGIVATFYFTSMSVEEVFSNTELEEKVVQDLLKKNGNEIQHSLELFGRVRRVPNAAAVYQRSRAVHGKTSEEAIQAVARAFAYECPDGDDKCTQPDISMFDMSKIKLVPPAETAGTTSRPQQENLMVQRIMSRIA
jgi:hypothetical protein